MRVIAWLTLAVVLMLCAITLVMQPALGQTAQNLTGSMVTLQPTKRSGAVAEVQFVNGPLNDPKEDGRYPLHLGGLSVPFTFTFTSGPDTIDLDPPDGITCEPVSCSLVVQEYTTGVIYLFSTEGVGM